jgi:hypothetical protein
VCFFERLVAGLGMEGKRRIDSLRAEAQRLRKEIQRIDQEVLNLTGKNGDTRKAPEKEVPKREEA